VAGPTYIPLASLFAVSDNRFRFASQIGEIDFLNLIVAPDFTAEDVLVAEGKKAQSVLLAIVLADKIIGVALALALGAKGSLAESGMLAFDDNMHFFDQVFAVAKGPGRNRQSVGVTIDSP
jgi:hypothetical protein